MNQITSIPTSQVGRPSLLKRYTRRDIIPITLELIYRAWPNVCKSTVVDCRSHEPQIAGALYNELWKLKTGVEPPHIECEAASRSDSELLIPDGRIDFKLLYGFQQDDYLSLECKRVSSTDSTLATNYVREGVVRFTSGKYAAGHDWAAMLAFVIDSNLSGSATLINLRLQALATETHLVGTIVDEASFGRYESLYRSDHKLPRANRLLNVLHLYVRF
jgi:hypothetical protein